ncbi:MAG: FAD-dependent oxidoreductase [Candidatus Bathyarchaeota archaeon]|nr:FAD-dependent oxidoreductase [Candidatus Bathyarchaeota archaeon]
MISVDPSGYMRFAFMYGKERPTRRLGKRVAIIGAGPSGLAAAGYLTGKGYDVTVYERLPLPGGIMVFGIPESRIPRERVLRGCRELQETFGVEIKTSCKVTADGEGILGDDLAKETVDLQRVVDEFDATIIATGTWKSRSLPAEGSGLKGIHSALEYLFRSKAHELGLAPKREMIKLGRSVAVVGSGLVAVDAAQEAAGEGRRINLISVENGLDAPSGSYEIDKLKRRGVTHTERTVIKRVLGKTKVEALEVISVNADVKNGVVLRMEQIPGTERVIEDVDSIIVGIGQIPTPPFGKDYREIKTLRWGGIEVNDRYVSPKSRVFATGDVTTGISKVGRAYQTGLKTACWVDRHLRGTA